jgi:hypothetical protein
MSKNLIELETTVGEKKMIYTGRFLGFIKDDEFNALIQNTDEVGPKLESKPTQPLLEVASKFDNMAGYRLVMVVKTENGKSVLAKKLFISESLSMIVAVTPRKERNSWDKVAAAWTDAPGCVSFQTENETIEVREAE